MIHISACCKLRGYIPDSAYCPRGCPCFCIPSCPFPSLAARWMWNRPIQHLKNPPRHIRTLGSLSFHSDSDTLPLIRLILDCGPSSSLAQHVHSVSIHSRNRILSDFQKAVANLYYCQPLLSTSHVPYYPTGVLSRSTVQMSIDFEVTYAEVSQ